MAPFSIDGVNNKFEEVGKGIEQEIGDQNIKKERTIVHDHIT